MHVFFPLNENVHYESIRNLDNPPWCQSLQNVSIMIGIINCLHCPSKLHLLLFLLIF